MRKLFRYYLGTRGFSLYLCPVKSLDGYKVVTYVDSDWAGDRIERNSTTGVAVTMNRATVLIYARTQQTVAHSTAAAKLNSIISGICESPGSSRFLRRSVARSTLRSRATAALALDLLLGLDKAA